MGARPHPRYPPFQHNDESRTAACANPNRYCVPDMGARHAGRDSSLTVPGCGSLSLWPSVRPDGAHAVASSLYTTSTTVSIALSGKVFQKIFCATPLNAEPRKNRVFAPMRARCHPCTRGPRGAHAGSRPGTRPTHTGARMGGAGGQAQAGAAARTWRRQAGGRVRRACGMLGRLVGCMADQANRAL